MGVPPWHDSCQLFLVTSLRYTFRSLARTPILSIVVVLSLGLGIGANTAIFSLMYQTLLRSLPVKNPQELVVLNSPRDFKSGRSSADDSGDMNAIFSYRIFRELEKDPKGLAGLAAYRQFGANLSLAGRTLDGRVAVVSGQYFPLLGVQAAMGRTLEQEDDRGAGNPVAVLSYGYWKDRLGGADNVLNQPLRVNGQIFTIVGVLPQGFTGLTLGYDPNVYVPLVFKPAMTPGWNGTDRYDDYWLYLFGRLQPGLSLKQAQDALNTVYAGLVAQQAKTVQMRDKARMERFLSSRLTILPGNLGMSQQREQMATPLRILIGCTGLVLLIAAANAANLLLARAAQRNRELAIRSAMGAGRRHIVRQLLAEAMLLAVAGCGVGLVFAVWTLDALISTMGQPGERIYFFTTQLEWPVLLYAVGGSLLTGLLFGLYPAWAASRADAAGVLKEDSANASTSRQGMRARRVLVGVQVAVSVTLLVPMGLFLKSLVNLTQVNLGMKTDNLLTFGISPELNGYTPERSRQLFERTEEALSAIPGVRGVTMAMVPLISGSNWGNDVTVEGFSPDRFSRDDPRGDNNARFNHVGPGFFSQMGIPLLRGREFASTDTLAAPKVAVVNEAFARHFFGEKDPVGRRFGLGSGSGVQLEYEIVGVVKNAHYSQVRQDPPKLYFRPYRQDDGIGSIQVYVRGHIPVAQLAPQVRKTMANLDPDLPLEGFRTMNEQISLNIRSDRLVLQLASAFAILATLLSMLGLYGVMAHNVARRTREIGIRMALGAGRQRIHTLVLRDVLWIFATGAVLGIPAALWLSKFAESQLFGVKALDYAVLAGSITVLAFAALFAGFVPARKAATIDPISALRYE
jgi:predicted permease